MACRGCHGRLRQFPAVYPLFWCEECEAVMWGSEEDVQHFRPRREMIWQALKDQQGMCLRDDRGECGLYVAAKQYAQIDQFPKERKS